MKKLFFAVLAATLVSAALFAQEETALEFSNEFGSDLISVTEDDSSFQGFYDYMKVAFDSEKVFAGVEAKAEFTTDSNGDPQSLSYNSDDFDWWVGFRPFNFLELALSEDYGTDGAYLPVEDDNLGNGKLGSSGFTALFKPLEILSLTFTAPFDIEEENFFKSTDEESDETKYFNMGFGAELAISENLKISGTVKNVLNSDETGFGVFAYAAPFEGLSVNAGYGYKSEGLCDVEADNLWLFGAQFENDSLSFLFDYLTSDEAFYTGCEVSFPVTDLLTPGVQVTLNSLYNQDDAEEGEKYTSVFKPFIVFNLNETNEFKIEADITINDKGFSSVCFPVYWKYFF